EKCTGNTERIARYKSRGKVSKPLGASKERSRDLWEPIPVPQFINESDFEHTQTLLKKNKELSSRNTKEPSILQGLLVCGLCGCSYYKKKRSKNNVNQTYYSCHSRLLKEKNSCNNRNIRQDILDKLIWENIIELLKNPLLIEAEINRRASDETITKPYIKEKINDLKRQEKQIEKAHNKLLDAYQEGDCLSLEQLRVRSKDLNQRAFILKKEIESLEAMSIRKKDY